jgi:hypothetical protein
MRTGGVRLVVAALVAALVAAGCSKKAGNPFGIGGTEAPSIRPLPTGVPSLPSPSGLPTGLPSGFPTELPSPPTNLPTGGLANGTAHLEVSGSVHGTFDMKLASPAIFVPPPGGIALIYSDDNGDALGLGGPSFTGTKKTSSTLIVTITIVSAGGFFGTSTGGECTIRLTTAEASRVVGTVVCAKMPGAGGSLDATATFTATP